MLLRVRFDCPWSNSAHSMNGISRHASTLDQDSRRDQAGAPYSSPAMNQDAFTGIQSLMNFLTDNLPSMLEAFVRDIHVADREMDRRGRRAPLRPLRRTQAWRPGCAVS